jgi:hypothetical protein
METQTVKEQVRQAVEEFPDDVTFEEALERIYDLAKAAGALDESDEEDLADHEIVHEFSATSISATMTTRFRRASAQAGSQA